MWKIMPQQQQRGAQFRPPPLVHLSELEGDERGFEAEKEPARSEREELDAARGQQRS